MTEDELTWAEWPKDRPRPTPDELEAARERYRVEMDRAYAEGYQGDAGAGLEFMMATYNRSTWWDFFFPEEKLDLGLGGTGLSLRCRPSRKDEGR